MSQVRHPVATSAPGKLFLIGEYAVLEHAPALLTAVDRRVHVLLQPAAGAHWTITAPNLGLHDHNLEADGRIAPGSGPAIAARLAVFDAVRQTLVERLGLALAPTAVTIDSQAFERDTHKLGLGSSAAVAAALTLALTCAAGLALSRERIMQLAIEAHRRAQAGTGSGGDVATAVYGGVLCYRQDRPPTALNWPRAIEGMVVVTGDGARTADLVARVKDYGRRDPDGYRSDMQRLCKLADTAQHELARGTPFLVLAEQYFQALARLDAHAAAGIITERHQSLHALAAREAGVFKTSGAGGGDVGLAFARRGEQAHRLGRALQNAGAEIVPLAFAAAGVRREHGP